jgi:hypothetical protein
MLRTECIIFFNKRLTGCEFQHFVFTKKKALVIDILSNMATENLCRPKLTEQSIGLQRI